MKPDHPISTGTSDDACAHDGAGRPHLDYSLQLHRALQQASVTHNQFLVMASLYERVEHRATPSDLSLDVGRTRSNVTLICNQLEECGWVTRKHGTDNRRRVDITLTEAGGRTIRYLLSKLSPEAVPETGIFDSNSKA